MTSKRDIPGEIMDAADKKFRADISKEEGPVPLFIEEPFSKGYLLPIWKGIVFFILYISYLFILLVIVICRPVGLSDDILDMSEDHPGVLVYFIIKSLAIYSAIIGIICLGYSLYLMWELVYF